MKNKYLLMFIIGVILVIAGLWLSFSKKPVYEGLIDTSIVVMIGLGATDTYYADQGLTSAPNWKAVSGTFTQISGSAGRLIGVTSANAVSYGTQYSVPGSPYNWVSVGGTMRQVNFDYPFVVGVDTAGIVKYINNITSNPTTAAWTTQTGILATKTFKCVATSLGRGFGIGTDNIVWYVPNIRSGEWKNVSGILTGMTLTQIVFEGDQVAVIDSTGTIYYADTNIATAPNWAALSGTKMKQISMKSLMGVGIGMDNNTYFAPSLKAGVWIQVSKPTTMTWIELMYPIRANMITERPAAMTPCNSGYSYYNSQCLTDCPSGFTTNGTSCQGNPVTRTTRTATVVPALTHTCPSGFDVNLTTAATCNAIVGGGLAAVAPVAEVYGLSVTSYTKAQAQDKCASYGAVLATTAQLTAARTAGASWTTPGWVSDSTTSVMYPGASTVVSAAPATGGVSGANCFGFKPPQGQFTDILPSKTGVWNQALQCPPGHNITTNATCMSTCPTGTTASGGSCIPPVVPKTSVASVTTNYTCPTGFAAPAVVTCSGSTCGPAQTCYSNCSSGFTASGTSCVGATSSKAQVSLASEVYAVGTGYNLTKTQAQARCTLHGGRLATLAEVNEARTAARADWCFWGWISDNGPHVVYPITTRTMAGCGNGAAQTVQNTIPASAVSSSTYGANCFGVKPAEGVYSDIFPLNNEGRYRRHACPAGYTQSGSTCYQNCPAGSTDIGNNQCQVNSTTRSTTTATYTPPCPTNYTQSGSTCYLSCASMTPSGMQDIGGNNCQLAITTRTTSTPTPVRSSLVPCNSDEDTVTNTADQTCFKKCAAGLISTATTCTPPTTTRTGYQAIFTCNSNETVQNGVCVSKCPDGTYPDGELCVSKMKVVAAPSTIKCLSSAFGNYKKWICDTNEDVAALLKNPSSDTTYVDPADQVCIADESDAGMYYCQSGEEAKTNSNTITTVKGNYAKTCANIKKNYIDLSNNLTSLILIQSGMSNGSTQLTTARTALNNIYTQLNCANPPNTQIGGLCTQINNGATAIGTDSTNISSVLANITPSIQAAMSSRDSLLSSITNFKCNT
jgi:hypothetical protein